MRSIGRSAYTLWCSGVLFPIHELIKGHNSTTRLRELEQSQWWSAEQIEHYRLERLRQFLSTVALTVPYYRRLFRNIGFSPSKVQTLADLTAIPLLTKHIIRLNIDSLK